MSDILRESLQRLHLLVDSSDHARGGEAGSLVQDISAYGLDAPEGENAFYLSLIFDDQFGILTFLKRTKNAKEFENARGDVLRFLVAYLEKLDVEVLPYIEMIRECLLSIYIVEKAMRLKTETINVINELAGNSKYKEKLQISDLIQRFLSECLKTTQAASGLRGALYTLMGTLAENYPDMMIDKSDRLLSLYLSFLKQETSSKRKPELLVVSGCLRGLTGLLVHFTQSQLEGSVHAKEIYRYCKMCIDPNLGLTRYDVPKAALGLLARHASQFKESVTDDSRALYEMLNQWSKSINKEVRTASLAAIETVLQQVALCIQEKGKGGKTEYITILKVFTVNFLLTSFNSDYLTIRN